MKGRCSMKKLLAVTFALLGFACQSFGTGCPFTVQCSIDGETMYNEGCETNMSNFHRVCRFGHDHRDFDGRTMHHYVYVDCDR